MKNFALSVVCAYLLFTLALVASPASALTVPERLVYDISWTGVKAATSVQEVTARGDELHIVSTTRSAPWLDSFFYLEDRADSVMPRGAGDRLGTPKIFRQNNTQRQRHAKRESRFDPVGLRVEVKDLLQKTTKTDVISSKTYDTLSSIYFVRSLELVPGRSVFLDIYDGRKLWIAEVRVLRREEITTPVGRFKTVVVQPLLKSKGDSPKFREMTIWLSDDVLRIPVMMTTKVKVGKLTARLVGGSYWPKE